MPQAGDVDELYQDRRLVAELPVDGMGVVQASPRARQVALLPKDERQIVERRGHAGPVPDLTPDPQTLLPGRPRFLEIAVVPGDRAHEVQCSGEPRPVSRLGVDAPSFLRRQAGRGHLAQPIERVGLAQERVGDQDARALSAALGRGAVGRRRSALEIAERPRDGRFREVDARVTRGDGGEAAQLRQRFHGLVALSARSLGGREPQAVFHIVREEGEKPSVDPDRLVPFTRRLTVASLHGESLLA